MKIVIITQDDPFYLGPNIDYLLSELPDYAQVVACIVTNVSPFGKKESFLAKAIKTLQVFGIGFFVRYAIRFIRTRISSRDSVLAVLKRHAIPLLSLSSSINSEASLNLLHSYEPDLLVSIAGNEIFRQPLIELAPLGCLNLHTALLPKYRGLMPSFWVLKNQEHKTGVSIFFVDEGIDSGPILVQKEIEISGMTQEELIRQTKRLGMDGILEAIDKLHLGDRSVIENDDAKKTYYSFPTHEDVKEFRKVGARFY